MPNLLNKLEKEAVEHLLSLLEQVPALNHEDIHVEAQHVPDGAVDFLVKVQYNGKTYVIVADVKITAPPRKVHFLYWIYNKLSDTLDKMPCLYYLPPIFRLKYVQYARSMRLVTSIWKVTAD